MDSITYMKGMRGNRTYTITEKELSELMFLDGSVIGEILAAALAECDEQWVLNNYGDYPQSEVLTYPVFDEEEETNSLFMSLEGNHECDDEYAYKLNLTQIVYIFMGIVNRVYAQRLCRLKGFKSMFNESGTEEE